jgi:DNA-binding response OmpR family regulator
MTSPRAEARRAKIILCVDDQVENTMALQAVLEGEGYGSRTARSGAECLNLVKQFTPSLIFLDIQMPEMDGFETCRRIRDIWTLRGVPIAFLTGRKSPEDVKAGLAAGGNDFLLKPFDYERLLARVEHWTQRSIGLRRVGA